jgi:hypothetical protein
MDKKPEKNYTLLDYLHVDGNDVSAVDVGKGAVRGITGQNPIYSTNYDNRSDSIAILLIAKHESGLEKRALSHTSKEDEDYVSYFSKLENHLRFVCDYVEDFSEEDCQIGDGEEGVVLRINPFIECYAMIVGSDWERMEEARRYLSDHLENVQIQEVLVHYDSFSVSLYNEGEIPMAIIAQGKTWENGKETPQSIIHKPMIKGD